MIHSYARPFPILRPTLIILINVAAPLGRAPVDPSSPSYTGSAHIDLEGRDRKGTFTFHARDIAIEKMTFTQFEATDARGAFPCWDEPEFKIPFQATLVIPEAHVAIGNTPVESETVALGQKTVVFEKTTPLPAYLLAIATGPLETVPIEGMPVPGRVAWIHPNASETGYYRWQVPPSMLAARAAGGPKALSVRERPAAA